MKYIIAIILVLALLNTSLAMRFRSQNKAMTETSSKSKVKWCDPYICAETPEFRDACQMAQTFAECYQDCISQAPEAMSNPACDGCTGFDTCYVTWFP